MKVTFDTPITILHVLTFARVLRYGLAMKHKPYQLCDDIIGEIRNMLDVPADQPAPTETGPLGVGEIAEMLTTARAPDRCTPFEHEVTGLPFEVETAPQVAPYECNCPAPYPEAVHNLTCPEHLKRFPEDAPQGAPQYPSYCKVTGSVFPCGCATCKALSAKEVSQVTVSTHILYQDTDSGELVLHVDTSWTPGYPDDALQFMFEDGNYSCDCNRALFMARALGRPELDMPCNGRENRLQILAFDVVRDGRRYELPGNWQQSASQPSQGSPDAR